MLYGRRGADGLIARVDCRAPRFERDGLRRPTVAGARDTAIRVTVSVVGAARSRVRTSDAKPGGVEQRVRVAERGAGGGGTVRAGEAARGAVVNVVPAIDDGSAA